MHTHIQPVPWEAVWYAIVCLDHIPALTYDTAQCDESRCKYNVVTVSQSVAVAAKQWVAPIVRRHEHSTF
jgi:hypothetical protein